MIYTYMETLQVNLRIKRIKTKLNFITIQLAQSIDSSAILLFLAI